MTGSMEMATMRMGMGMELAIRSSHARFARGAAKISSPDGLPEPEQRGTRREVRGARLARGGSAQLSLKLPAC
jgi:hypothetical protein